MTQKRSMIQTLRYREITNLRVIDNSVIPASFMGYTNTAGIMIGEKMSHIIKNKWKVKNL